MNQSNSIDFTDQLDKWWSEQRKQWGEAAPQNEQAVQDVFNLLACALGPFRAKDFSTLIGESAKSDLSLDEIFDIVSPFVVSDGEIQGYMFKDSNTGEYFYDLLTEEERQILESHYLDWGRQVLEHLEDGKLSPESAPAYVVQHFGAHLERNGSKGEELFSLISDTWRRAWVTLEGAYAGFLDDIQRVWRTVVAIDKKAVKKDRPAPQLATEIRCALCNSSVVSLARDVSPVLMGALVEKKVWTPAQALAYTLSKPEGHRNLDILAPHLSEELLQQALSSKLEIEDWHVRTHYLIELAPFLTEVMLSNVLAIVKGEIEDWAFWGKIKEFATHLTEEMIGEVFVALQGTENWKARVDALVALAPHLSDAQLRETLGIARALENEGAQAYVIVKLIPHLPQSDRDGLVTEALTAARLDEQYRVSTLAEVLCYLPEDQRNEIVNEALDAASELDEEIFRLIGLEQLTPYMTESLAKKFLSAFHTIKNNWNQAYALEFMAPHLPESAIPEALAAVNAIEDSGQQADALAALAPYLSENLLRESVKKTLLIDKEGGVAGATAKLIPHLQEGLLKEALVGAQEFEEELYAKDKTMAALALQFAEIGNNQEAFKVMREVEGTWAWVEVLSELAPHLSDTQFRETLKAARAIDNNWRRADALNKLAPYVREVEKDVVIQEALATARVMDELIPLLSETQLRQALEIVQKLDDKDEQTELRITLAAQLADSGHTDKALGIIKALDNEDDRAIGLAELVPHIPESERDEVLNKAMDAARKIESNWTRANVLGELAQSISNAEQDEVLKEAFKVALEIDDETDKESTISWLASSLPESLVREAIKFVQRFRSGSYVLASLAQRLAELGYPNEGLDLAKDILYERTRVETIAALAPKLSKTQLKEALDSVYAIDDVKSRAIGMAGLAVVLPDDEGIGLFQEALETVKTITIDHERSSSLSDLAPYVTEATQDQFMTAVNEIEQDMWRDSPRQSLASRINELGLHDEALQLAKTIESDYSRVITFAELAPYLSEEELVEAMTFAKEILFTTTRKDILASLTPELVKLPRLHLLDIWQDILPALAANPRGELLQDLCALMPVISKLGGQEVLVEINQTVDDIGGWWP